MFKYTNVKLIQVLKDSYYNAKQHFSQHHPKQNVKLNYYFHESHQEDHENHLIALHGILGNAKNFNPILKNPKIKDITHSYAIDLRNHGLSDHAPTMSYKEMANDLHYFLEEQDIKSPFLLGHSMGARVVMEYATMFPDLIKGVIIVDLAPYDYKNDSNFNFIDKFYSQIISLSKIDLNSDLKSIRKSVASVAESEEEYNLFIMNLKPTQNGQYKWKMNLQTILQQYNQIMDIEFYSQNHKKYEGPVKVLLGTHSDYVSPYILDSFNKVFSNFNVDSNVTWISDASHWVHAHKPNHFIEEVIEFVSNYSLQYKVMRNKGKQH